MCVCLYELVVYDVWSRDIHVLSAIRTHLFPLSIRPCVGIVRGLTNIYTIWNIYFSIIAYMSRCIRGLYLNVNMYSLEYESDMNI